MTVRLITLKVLQCSWNFVGKQIVSNYSVDYLDQSLLDQLEKSFISLHYPHCECSYSQSWPL